jgi:hypothetical protein
MTYLNLDELLNNRLDKQRRQLEIFEEVLKSCHKMIQRYSRQHKQTECIFTVPVFIFGKPPYSLESLKRYLVDKLEANGLYTEVVDETHILISWHIDRVDYEKYKATVKSGDDQHGGAPLRRGRTFKDPVRMSTTEDGIPINLDAGGVSGKLTFAEFLKGKR